MRANTNNDGAFNWKIPGTSLATGSNYKIRITSTTKGTVKDSSDKYFTVKKSSPGQDYTYLYKHNAFELDGYTIRWKSKTVQVSGATGSWQTAVNQWPTVKFSYIGSPPAEGNGIEIVGYRSTGWTGNVCGLAYPSWYSSGKMAACKVYLNPSVSCRSVEQNILTHEIGHCIGIFKHTADGGLMDAVVRNGTFTSPIRNMISLLYSLAPGTNINSKLAGRGPVAALQKSKNSKYDPTGKKVYTKKMYFMKNGDVRIVDD